MNRMIEIAVLGYDKAGEFYRLVTDLMNSGIKIIAHHTQTFNGCAVLNIITDNPIKATDILKRTNWGYSIHDVGVCTFDSLDAFYRLLDRARDAGLNLDFSYGNLMANGTYTVVFGLKKVDWAAFEALFVTAKAVTPR